MLDESKLTSIGDDSILRCLYTLSHTTDDQEICFRLASLCRCLSNKIDALCTGATKEQELELEPERERDLKIASNNEMAGRRTRQIDVAIAQRRLLDSAWFQSVDAAIDSIFRRLFQFSICKLTELTKDRQLSKTMDSSINTATGVITDLVLSMVASLHGASVELNSENPKIERSRDIRPALVKVLQSFISTLDINDRFQGGILEAALFVIIEATGKCLCYPTRSKSSSEVQSLKETSSHILELLKVAIPLYQVKLANISTSQADNNAELSNVLGIAKQRFHDTIMKGLFGETKLPEWKELKDHQTALSTGTSTTSWGGINAHDDFTLVEDGIADKVWQLLELGDFGLVW